MNQPARRKTDADATGANQSNVTDIFCGKLNVVQLTTLPEPQNRQKALEQKALEMWGFPPYPQSSRIPAWRSCRGLQVRERGAPDSRFRQAGWPKYPPKTKDPSGGTTGRVKLYGRLGGMGTRAEYSLD